MIKEIEDRRTCVAAGARLHLIEPLGFLLNEKMVKRAGLDYWDNSFSQFDTRQTASGTTEPHELVQLLRLL